eukprot:jgi/Galph1/3276/GphlegSOOS_G1902.1
MSSVELTVEQLRRRAFESYGSASAVVSVNPPLTENARTRLLQSKYAAEYDQVNSFTKLFQEGKPQETPQRTTKEEGERSMVPEVVESEKPSVTTTSKSIDQFPMPNSKPIENQANSLVVPEDRQTAILEASKAISTLKSTSRVRAVQTQALQQVVQGQRGLGPMVGIEKERPQWHPPWKLMRVISAHYGWVRSLAFDVTNEWFCSGSADRTIKFWDFASGELKLTLTGHIGTVRGLCVSTRHPYLFSVGDDKQVKCWDLEYNKVIRHYHGHLSGVYSVSLHPTLDVLVTGGRDATARVWDIRTKQQIFSLTGHRDAVYSIETQGPDPQVITSSADSTIKLWDLSAGRCFSTLTHHKKGVRSVVIHPREFSFASASAGRIKTFVFPNGELLRNFYGHNTIVNSLAINEDDVLVSAGDDGSLVFWDYKAAHEFFRTNTIAQPGSLESETGIFACCFDRTGTRLVTGEADKTIKVWKEDEDATEETHPVQWQPPSAFRRY